MQGFTIGQAAKESGVNVETLRYYEQMGLIAQPPRPAQGYRRYPPETVRRVRFVKRAQQLGFTLEEIRRLLSLADGETCGTARALAEEKLALVEARIADLQRMRKTLKELVLQCAARRGKVACPIIEALAQH